jgi:beta-lactamase regulating signal transducer with metallopeptidase domain
LTYENQSRVNDQEYFGVAPGPAFQALNNSAGFHEQTLSGSDESIFTAFYHNLLAFMENHANWMVMLWFAGFLIFLIRFAGSLLYIHRLKKSHLCRVDDQWEAKLLELAKRIGLNRKIHFAESALAKIPMTIGYLKPVILLPVGAISGVPPQQIEAILLHELAHILRKDYLLNIIQSCIEWLMFYHPATWWLSGLIREEREHICDDIVISVNQDHINYIKALTTMEELNIKSPSLATAITGNRRKLLARVKRIIAPGKLRKGFSEGSIAFVLFIGLLFILSLNAFTYIPSTNDLKGKESGEHVYNILPFNPTSQHSSVPVLQPEPVPQSTPAVINDPDTIISTSRSGKVVVHLYTDSTDVDAEKNLQVFVETIDDMVNDRQSLEKELIILKREAEMLDSLKRVKVIKVGDSIKVIKDDTIIWIPAGMDTSFTTSEGFSFYEFEMPEVPDLPYFRGVDDYVIIYDQPDIPKFEYHYEFDGDSANWVEWDQSRAEFERQLRDFERQQHDFERQMRSAHVEINAPDFPREFKWTSPDAPVSDHNINKAGRIIRQELADDGLTVKGKKYIIELDSRSMYINGEKQSKDTYRKYRRLVESLEEMNFDGDDTYKLIY